MISYPPLSMTYSGKVFWQGKEVHLRVRHSKRQAPMEKNSRFLHRLLIALVDRHDRFVPPQELAQDLWPQKVGAENFNRFVARNLGRAIHDLQVSFREVDPGFASLKAKKRTGYAWDTGDWQTAEQIGDFPLRPALFQAQWNGEVIQMSPRYFRFFRALLEADGAITYAKLYCALMDRQALPCSPRTNAQLISIVRVEMVALRNFFRAVDPQFDRIKAVISSGYYLEQVTSKHIPSHAPNERLEPLSQDD